jgi:diaminopropionate ammonia-lyase
MPVLPSMGRLLACQPTRRAPVAPPTRDALQVHERLPGYAPTPLRAAPALASSLDVGSVWLKDESERLGLSSFKVLGASWALYRALERRRGTRFAPWDSLEELAAQLGPNRQLTLTTATDGNHGHAVAWLAHRLGMAARIYVPRGVPVRRRKAIAGDGAELVDVDGTYDEAVAVCDERAGPEALVLADTTTGADDPVPSWVIEGYATMLWDVDAQLAAAGASGPDVIVVPLGVGALGAAVVRHYRGLARATRIVGFEPQGAACVMASVAAGRRVTVPGPHDSVMAGLNCGAPSAAAWPLLIDGFDVLLSIDDAAAVTGVRALEQIDVRVGECAGGAVGAADC